MTKNPLINALAAIAYIVLIVVTMFSLPKFDGPESSALAPIAMISLFTLSAAVMGYLFLYTPAELYFESHKKEGVELFLKTVACFAVIVVILLLIIASGVL